MSASRFVNKADECKAWSALKAEQGVLETIDVMKKKIKNSFAQRYNRRSKTLQRHFKESSLESNKFNTHEALQLHHCYQTLKTSRTFLPRKKKTLITKKIKKVIF